MIRTFILAVALTLAAGVSVGFFVAEAAGRGGRGEAIPAAANPVDRAIENRVRAAAETYVLTSAQEQAVRAAFRDYDSKLATLFRRLQFEHKAEFQGLAQEANRQVAAALKGAEKRVSDGDKPDGTDRK